jgi:hypothetical protein
MDGQCVESKDQNDDVGSSLSQCPYFRIRIPSFPVYSGLPPPCFALLIPQHGKSIKLEYSMQQGV